MSTDIDGVALWKLYVFPTAKKVIKSKEKLKCCYLQATEGRNETHH